MEVYDDPFGWVNIDKTVQPEIEYKVVTGSLNKFIISLIVIGFLNQALVGLNT